MKATLIFRIFKKDRIHLIKQFTNEERIIIGNSADVHINLGSEISAIHCLVEKRGSDYFLCDMGSENGTFKNNKSIIDEKLNHGDEFFVGNYRILFFIGKNVIGNEGILNSGSTEQPQGFVSNDSKLLSNHNNELDTMTHSPIEQVLRPGKGTRIEVMICWHERVLDTYHFSIIELKNINLKNSLHKWSHLVPKELNLLISKGVVTVVFPDSVQLELIHDDDKRIIKNNKYELRNEELCCIKLHDGLQLIVRFSSESPEVVFDSPLMLSSSELTGILASLIIATMTSLLVSVYKPKLTKENTEPDRLVQVTFNNFDRTTPVALSANQTTAIPQVVPLQDKNEKPTMPITVLTSEEKTDLGAKGKASSVKPIEKKSKIKMFTSTKPAGAIKTGSNDGANAKSEKIDIKNAGLLAAFGVGGAREKLDRAYSGSGQLIGESEKATGSSGFKQNRPGGDLGTKTKDTGMGGVGTATQGVPDLNLKGSGSGLTYYGNGDGLGEKGNVQISVGSGGESIVGSIDREAVRRVILYALPQFKACYEREYRKDTSLKGRIAVRWEIDEKGTAKNAIIVRSESTLNNVQVQECVKLRMLGLKFPETPAGTFAEVTYPFLFEGPKN